MPGPWLWLGAVSAPRIFLLFSLTPLHPSHLAGSQISWLNPSLASASFCCGQNVPTSVPSVPSSYLRPLASLAPRTFDLTRSRGPQSPALTVSILRARPCAGDALTQDLVSSSDPALCSLLSSTFCRLGGGGVGAK